MIADGVWAKEMYVIAGGPPFLLCRKEGVIHDEITFETLAEYPTLEAAVMRAELADDMQEGDYLTNAILRKAIRIYGGPDAGSKRNR